MVLQGLLFLHLPHIHDVSQQDVIDSRFRMLKDILAFNFGKSLLLKYDN